MVDPAAVTIHIFHVKTLLNSINSPTKPLVSGKATVPSTIIKKGDGKFRGRDCYSAEFTDLPGV